MYTDDLNEVRDDAKAEGFVNGAIVGFIISTVMWITTMWIF